LLITVMDKDSTVDSAGGTVSTAPFQPKDMRWMYSKSTVSSRKSNFYSGGFSKFGSGSSFSPPYFSRGGYWVDDEGGKALSWVSRKPNGAANNMVNTLFIGGKYGSVPSSGGRYVTYGCIVDKTTLGVALAVDLSIYRYVVALIFTNYTTSATTLEVYGCSPTVTSEFIPTQISTTAITLPSANLTGFNATAREMAALSYAGATQSVDILTFNSTYTGFSSTTEYSATYTRVEQTFEISVTPTTPFFDAFMEHDRSTAVISGDPLAVLIAADGKGFSVLREQVTTYSDNYHADEKNVGDGALFSGYRHATDSKNTAGYLDMMYLQTGEAPAFTATFGAYTTSASGFENLEYEASAVDPYITYERSTTAVNKFYAIQHFSARTGSAIFVEITNTETSTDTSVVRLGSNDTEYSITTDNAKETKVRVLDGGVFRTIKTTTDTFSSSDTGVLFGTQSTAINDVLADISSDHSPSITVSDAGSLVSSRDNLAGTAATATLVMSNITVPYNASGNTFAEYGVTVIADIPSATQVLLEYRLDLDPAYSSGGITSPISVTQKSF
jgi:hypothetical protein